MADWEPTEEMKRGQAALAKQLGVDAVRELEAERDEAKADYEGACKTIADMHEAAVGEVRGPTRGVVEDVADLRTERDELRMILDRGPLGALDAIRGERDGLKDACIEHGRQFAQAAEQYLELEAERDALEARLEGIEIKEQELVGYPEMDVLRKVRNERDALKAEVARLRALVLDGAETLERMSSSDGSGHADLGRRLRERAGGE